MPKATITADLTIAEFCALEGISYPTYYNLRRRGLAPEETSVDGTWFVRISAEARRKWREQMER
jgi:hypothetical protein